MSVNGELSLNGSLTGRSQPSPELRHQPLFLLGPEICSDPHVQGGKPDGADIPSLNMFTVIRMMNRRLSRCIKQTVH